MSEPTQRDIARDEPRQEGREPRGPTLLANEDIRDYLARVEALATSLPDRFDKSDWVELLAAVLIAVATIATAWSAYQSTRWSGNQALETAAVNRARFESMNVSQQYVTQYLTDVTTWESYVKAIDEGNDSLASFWLEHARPEFRPVLEDWVAIHSKADLQSLTPFDLPGASYQTEAHAGELRKEAEQHARAAAASNQRSDNYVLLTVLFALVLFFAGVGTKFKSMRIRRLMVSVATIVFVIGLTFLLAMPENIGV